MLHLNDPWEHPLHPLPSLLPMLTADFLQLKPTEIDIRAHVCQKDGDKWPVVCKYLGVPPAKVQMARSNNPNQEEDACFEAVMHWRSGNTSVAVSWVGLLEALKRGDLGDVADSIAVQNGVEPVSGCCCREGQPLVSVVCFLVKGYRRYSVCTVCLHIT